MSKKISLKQYMMKSGRFERVQDAVDAIVEGDVAIDGNVIQNPNYFFNPKSLVQVSGQKVKAIKKYYYIMNKPAGHLSQKSKNEERTIYDLLETEIKDPKIRNSLFAVGRLDKETEGLLIITNDGQLADKILQPVNEIEKEYYVSLSEPISPVEIQRLQTGVKIMLDNEPYITKPCTIELEDATHLFMKITEGKKRQIRRMFESVGTKVIYLRRIGIGGLRLGKIRVGRVREISKEDILNALEASS